MKRAIGTRPAPLAWAILILLASSALGCGQEIQSPGDSEPTALSAEAAVTFAPNTWTPRPGIPESRRNYRVGTFPNPAGVWLVYVIGGLGPTGSFQQFSHTYNVETNSWAQTGPVTDVHSFNGVSKIGVKLYFAGGEMTNDNSAVEPIYPTTWAYEPHTNRLFQKADMPRAALGGTTAVIQNKLYALPGGEDFRELHRYDPSTNTWVTRTRPPQYASHAVGVIDDKLYMVGGRTSSLNVYNPATNSWSSRAPIPAPASATRWTRWSAVIQRKLFVISRGYNLDGTFSSISAFSYDPATNSWTRKAAPPGLGPLATVGLNGQQRLFLAGAVSSYLYTP